MQLVCKGLTKTTSSEFKKAPSNSDWNACIDKWPRFAPRVVSDDAGRRCVTVTRQSTAPVSNPTQAEGGGLRGPVAGQPNMQVRRTLCVFLSLT